MQWNVLKTSYWGKLEGVEEKKDWIYQAQLL